jgi:hypothetical protein
VKYLPLLALIVCLSNGVYHTWKEIKTPPIHWLFKPTFGDLVITFFGATCIAAFYVIMTGLILAGLYGSVYLITK